jgi:hypothetical protein
MIMNHDASHFFPLCTVLTIFPVPQDHAPGSLLVEEAGGIISDSRGHPLDFGCGRMLGENFGVVAARREVHAQVIEAVQVVLAEGEGEVVRDPRYVVCLAPPCSQLAVNVSAHYKQVKKLTALELPSKM